MKNESRPGGIPARMTQQPLEAGRGSREVPCPHHPCMPLKPQGGGREGWGAAGRGYKSLGLLEGQPSGEPTPGAGRKAVSLQRRSSELVGWGRYWLGLDGAGRDWLGLAGAGWGWLVGLAGAEKGRLCLSQLTAATAAGTAGDVGHCTLRTPLMPIGERAPRSAPSPTLHPGKMSECILPFPIPSPHTNDTDGSP